MLALTTFGAAVLGYVTRETALGDGDGVSEQLVELLERARTAEARATFAEQQLASAGYGSFAVQSPRLASDDEVLAADARRKLGSRCCSRLRCCS